MIERLNSCEQIFTFSNNTTMYAQSRSKFPNTHWLKTSILLTGLLPVSTLTPTMPSSSGDMFKALVLGAVLLGEKAFAEARRDRIAAVFMVSFS